MLLPLNGTQNDLAGDGSVVLVAPPGTVTEPVFLHYTAEPVSALPGIDGAVLRSFRLTGTTSGGQAIHSLAQPVELDISLAAATSVNATALRLYVQEADGTWRPLGVDVLTTWTILRGRTTTLGTFAVVGKPVYRVSLPFVRRQSIDTPPTP